MHGDRGKAIASRLRQMWVRGCNIKIVYAVFGNEVLNILRHTSRGPVPIRQIAQDFDKDGVYDRYLHMKTMAISGVWNGRTNANVTWNGSANWTGVALASDEIVMRIFDANVRPDLQRLVRLPLRAPAGLQQQPRDGRGDAARAEAGDRQRHRPLLEDAAGLTGAPRTTRPEPGKRAAALPRFLRSARLRCDA